MKKLIKIIIIIFFVIFFLVYIPCYADNLEMCQEDADEICKEYNDFIAFLITGTTTPIISADLIYIFNEYTITTDGSENDPLNPDFYKCER